MKKFAFIILGFALFCLNSFAQQIGDWKAHFSYQKDVKAIALGEEVVYAVSDGKLFSYDPSDESLEPFVKIGEDSITHMGYSNKTKGLLILRSNLDIDIVYSQNKRTNISDLKNMSLNLDKTINDLYIDGDLAYLSTNFGLVVLNLAKEEVKESAIFRYPFYSSCVFDGKLYAFTSKGTMYVDLTQNIQYPDNWNSISLSSKYSGGATFKDEDILKGVTFNNKIAFRVSSSGLYTFDGVTVEHKSAITNPQNLLIINNDRLIVSNSTTFWDFSTWDNLKKISVTSNNLNYIVPSKSNANEYWVSLENLGLSYIKLTSESSFEIVRDLLIPGGPLSNFPYSMTYSSNKLFTVGGYSNGRGKSYPACLSEYKDKKWFHYDRSEIEDFIGQKAFDFVGVKVNPSDSEHVFVTAFNNNSGGLYEFKNRKLVKFHNGESNKAFGYTFNVKPWLWLRVMDFDKNGNLWIPNTTAASVTVRKNDDSWVKLSYSELIMPGQSRGADADARSFVIDKYNNKWCGGAFFMEPCFLFVFNENQAGIDNVVGHKVKHITTFYDQDGKSLAIKAFNSLAEDKNGNIWVGTDIGIFVIYNSSTILSKETIVFNKIKIPKNDGTNEANILLENVVIQDIKIDGANRKWVATNSGLYVVSSNGQETYHYFTNENSILPSNNVISLAIDPETGIVYIGTEKGLVSYKGEAIEGSKSLSDVYAYPNPVKPDYDGPIAIKGLKENSNVKITDMKGNLINQGVSLGGQYIWDGRNVNRVKVDTGVYIVFGSSEDGQEGAVTKIMVVNN